MIRTGLSGLAVAALLTAGCSAFGADVAEVAVAPAEDWVDTVSIHEPTFTFAQSVSPDGRWLATAARETCIHSLVDDVAPICASEETMGADTLSWNADSTLVTPGSTLSGRWDNVGVWTVATDGALTSIVPVEEGDLLDGDPGHWGVGMAFRPDGESIVFIEARDGSDEDDDQAEVVEVDLDGGRQVLAGIDGGLSQVANRPLLPLSDGRVVVTSGVIDNLAIDVLDDGRWTRLVTGNPDVQNFVLPVAVEVQPVDESLVLVHVPHPDARGVFTGNEWSLVDFDGNEVPLVGPGGREVVAATFSPDGRYLGYVSVERFESLDVDFHVAEVQAVLDGGEALGTLALEHDVASGLLRGTPDDPRIMRWATDGRVLIAVPNLDVVPVIDIDLSAE